MHACRSRSHFIPWHAKLKLKPSKGSTQIFFLAQLTAIFQLWIMWNLLAAMANGNDCQLKRNAGGRFNIVVVVVVGICCCCLSVGFNLILHTNYKWNHTKNNQIKNRKKNNPTNSKKNKTWTAGVEVGERERERDEEGKVTATSAKKCKQFIEFAITRTFGTHTRTHTHTQWCV